MSYSLTYPFMLTFYDYQKINDNSITSHSIGANVCRAVRQKGEAEALSVVMSKVYSVHWNYNLYHHSYLLSILLELNVLSSADWGTLRCADFNVTFRKIFRKNHPTLKRPSSYPSEPPPTLWDLRLRLWW